MIVDKEYDTASSMIETMHYDKRISLPEETELFRGIKSLYQLDYITYVLWRLQEFGDIKTYTSLKWFTYKKFKDKYVRCRFLTRLLSILQKY